MELHGMICPIGTYPSPYQTCHDRRFQQWVSTGIFEQVLHALATDLHERGGLDLSKCYIDGGTFIVAKKEGWGTKLEGRLSRGAKVKKKLMAISDSSSLPIARHIASTASPHHEVTALAEATLSKCFVSNEKPEHLVVGDKAYDSDPLEQRVVEYGVELISPHRFNRQRPRMQDSLPLRRYKRRWKIERLFAWLHNFRRIPLRYDEYHAESFLGFVQLGSMMNLGSVYEMTYSSITKRYPNLS
jgi:transposase